MEEISLVSCWYCGGKISPADAYCRFCGKGQGRRVPWYYKHWGIIFLTLLALGPFSLVFVWKSPLISKNAKWGYTAAISLLTGYVLYKLYGLWLALSAFFAPMTDPSILMM